MRKGFSVTLATVAFATLGFQAMAMAPTIGDIPDIVVGSGPVSTASNVFVFPDAVDLNTKVTDDDTTPGQIIWSYSVTDPTNPTTQVYALNGADPVILASESRVTPPTAKRISSQDSDPAKVDANARTITVRNVKRSPLPAQASYPAPAEGPGILTADTKVVTLHASDGSTASSANILIYSDNGGDDRFSPAEEVVLNLNFAAGAGLDWTFVTESGTNPTSSRTGGLCMTSTSAAATQFMGKWFSPYGIINLAANSVYEARMTVSTSQTTVGLVPAWSMQYDNISATGAQGKNEYGGSVVFLDNEGGALSPIAPNGLGGSKNYSVMMVPAQFQAPQFNNSTTGFFRPANDADADMRLLFRLFETTAISGYEADAGSMCLVDIEVIRHDFADMSVSATPFQLTTFSTTAGAANQVGIDQVTGAGIDNTNMTVESGGTAVTLTPADGSWDLAVVNFRPGDTTVNLGSTTGNENRDNWPVPWKADTLYYIEYQLSAPTTADEQNPPDVISVAGDVLTGEYTTDSYVVPNSIDDSQSYPAFLRGISTPRVGTPQKYISFWQGLKPSNSTIVDSDRLRPKLAVLCVQTLNPGGRTNNTGSVRIHRVTVQEVSF